LIDPAGHTWLAFDGMVVLSKGHAAESHRDPARAFERALLESGPAEVRARSAVDRDV